MIAPAGRSHSIQADRWGILSGRFYWGRTLANFITDDDVKEQVAAELSLADATALEAKFDTICPWAATKASGVIRRTLVARGYTVAQVEAWDDLDEFAVQLSVYWSMARGLNNGANDVWVEKLKAAEEELENVPILIDGEVADPEGEDSRVGQGDLSTATDLVTQDIEW